MHSYYGRPSTADSVERNTRRSASSFSEMPDGNPRSSKLIPSSNSRLLLQSSRRPGRREVHNSEDEHSREKTHKSQSKRQIKCLKAEVTKAKTAKNQLKGEVEQLLAEIRELREENGRLKAKCASFEAEMSKLKRHVCPLRVESDGNRTVDTVMRNLWDTLIAKELREYKESVCSEVHSKGVCSHLSIQSGLDRFGFYLSHAEALNLVRQVAGVDEASEELCISVDAFRARLVRAQPFPLEEELRCLAVLFCLHKMTPQALKSRLNAVLSVEKLKHKLSPFSEQLGPKKLHNICEFLLRGEQEVGGSAVFRRAMKSLPTWKSLSELTHCKERLLEVLENNTALRNALRECAPSLDRKAFRALWERLREDLSADEELFLVAVSTKHALKHSSADSLMHLSKVISVKKLLGWRYKDDILPSTPAPLQYLEDSDTL